MSPVFNITIILCYIAIIGLFIGLKDQRANIAVIACVFVVYFMYAKKAYRDNMTKIAMFLGSITTGTQKSKRQTLTRKKVNGQASIIRKNLSLIFLKFK